jgi:hypothetical protein
MGETTTADTCSRHTRAKSQGRPPGITGSQPTGQRRPTHHDLSLDEPLSRKPTTLHHAASPASRHPPITAVSCLGIGISRGRRLRSVRRCTPGSARVRACCAWAMTARPASVSDVGSGQRPFLRDAFQGAPRGRAPARRQPPRPGRPVQRPRHRTDRTPRDHHHRRREDEALNAGRASARADEERAHS